MKRTLLIAVLAVSSVLVLGAFGWGPGPMRHGKMDPKKVDNFLTYRLNDVLDDVQATPAQRQQILAIKDRLMPEAKRLMAERGSHRDEVKQLWLSDSPDPRAVHALIDQRADEMKAFADKVADGILEAHRILTPAQRAQLAERAEKMHQRFEP